MKAFISLLAFLILAQLSIAQTVVRITGVSLTENETSIPGQDAMLVLGSDEGSRRSFILTASDATAEVWAKVSTHNVRRSSVKDGAVNLMMEIDLIVGGDKDNRRVERIFYAGDARTARISERFTFKNGINVRTLVLAFDIAVE